ncbi:5'/3'-nucleotidase SurE [Plasticicumulans sp.]|uniref:5'/3'-nucleotidase SurE n=1 Tax=Plasticicumulans sp. TaxID=2307179 RepID=UPI00392D6370|nr:5'/3'-nucleotidase SurE [Pseudomonadota bacterium]
MRILVSNDDGYLAPGIRALAQALAGIAEITVAAPDRNRSGASNSLTLDRPLSVIRHPDGVWSLDGTPTDCVHVALTGLMEHEPDMVVSGINAGANLGDDVLYSGTVAAAMEGRFLGRPAMAVSLCAYEPDHLDTAARVALHLVGRLCRQPLPADTILNVNVPAVPWSELRGWQVTRLGHRHKAEPAVCTRDPRGRPIWWIGPAGAESDAGPGTDFQAIREHCVSVTPIQVDLTRHAALDTVARWLDAPA